MKTSKEHGIPTSASRCHVIAEIGVNHDGSLDKAYELIDAARSAGADSVKFQFFDPSALVVPGTRKAAYQEERDSSATQNQMLDKLVLSRADFLQLKNYCDQNGIVFLCTPFDLAAARYLAEIDTAAIKISSGDLTFQRLLQLAGTLGKPVILSTGMASMDEVDAAVRQVSESQSGSQIRSDVFPPLSILHCTSAYPAPMDSLNLRAIGTLSERFGVNIGYSDHSDGILVAPVAVALGARIIEKHLTLDRSAAGPDHLASIEPAAFASMVESIRAVEASLGSGAKELGQAETDTAEVARRSLFLTRDFEKGEKISGEDVIELRPGTGILANEIDSVVGMRVNVDLAAGTMIQRCHLET